MPTRQAGGFRKRPITHIGCEGDEAPLICPPDLPCIAIIAALIAGEGGVILDTTGSSGLFFDVHYNFNDGETEGDIGCQELSESYPLGEISQYFQETLPAATVITLNVSQNECDTVACSTSFTINPEAVEVELEGEDFIFTPTAPDCEGEIAFVSLFVDGLTDTVLDTETGQLTIPAQTTAGGAAIYYMTCDGNVVAVYTVAVTNPPVGLRMVFDDIANAPVVDPTNVGQWNTFYDLPTNGAVFTSVVVAGNQVTLIGGGAMTIRAQAFEADSNLLEIYDDGSVVVAILNSAFALSVITDATFDSAITIGASAQPGAFLGASALVDLSLAAATTFINDFGAGSISTCTSIVTLSLPSALILPSHFLSGSTALQTFSAPLATDLGVAGMANCTSITYIDLSSCVNLGSSAADAGVFNGITGQTVRLDIAAVNATNNGGGVHASVAYLIANNTAAVNYI
jgi:hypothetical protein